MSETETTEQYVARVGSLFAIAVYRDQARKMHAKWAQVDEAKRRMRSHLRQYFDDESTPETDETVFESAMGFLEQHYLSKAADFNHLESEAIRLNLPGTNPGTQAHLDGNGINIQLADIQQELDSPGMY